MKVNADMHKVNHGIDHQTLKHASNNQADSPQAIDRSKQDPSLSAVASPSVVYHTREEAQPVVFTKNDKAELYRSVAEDHQLKSANVNKASRHMNQTASSMKPVYADFKQQLAETYPQLAEKEFGITVKSDGSLRILDNKSQLSAQEQKDISQFINSYDGAENFSKLALEFAEASVDYVEAERGLRNASRYIGRYDLTVENFNQAFDFTPMLERELSFGATSAFAELGYQLYSSDLEETHKYAQQEKYIDGKWVAVTEQPSGTQQE